MCVCVCVCVCVFVCVVNRIELKIETFYIQYKRENQSKLFP